MVKIYTGIVAEIHENEPETFLPKEIHSILDADAIVPEANCNFEMAFEYYLCNIMKFIVLCSQVL